MFDVIIPLRSGSKGLKNKNIKMFGDDNLVNHTIKKLLNIKDIKRIFILTDSKDYKKKTLINPKVNTKFIRPKKLSKDNSSIFDLVKSFIKWSDKNEYFLNDMILMQVTSPLLSIIEIKKSLRLIKTKKLNSLFHVSKMIENPHFCILNKNKDWKYLLKKRVVNRQSSKKYFFITGSMFYFKKKFFLKNKKFINSSSYAFEVNKKNFIDIDDNFDFQIALAANKI